MPPHIGLDGKTDAGNDDAEGREDGAYGVHDREQLVPEGDDAEGEKTDSIEYQEQLPRLEREVRVEEVGGRGHERREAEVHRQRDGPVPDQPCPARDEGQDCPVPLARELERPVVRPC